eukprot:scaffold307_cov390-Prasinococcus_capsulatus_cf.AAC.28
MTQRLRHGAMEPRSVSATGCQFASPGSFVRKTCHVCRRRDLPVHGCCPPLLSVTAAANFAHLPAAPLSGAVDLQGIKGCKGLAQ